jgi:hypothetical protein
MWVPQQEGENSSDFCYVIHTLFPLCRKMRLSQKTVYQMYQAMSMPGNFWLMHQLKDYGCHWGKKSKLCNVSVEEFQ